MACLAACVPVIVAPIVFVSPIVALIRHRPRDRPPRRTRRPPDLHWRKAVGRAADDPRRGRLPGPTRLRSPARRPCRGQGVPCDALRRGPGAAHRHVPGAPGPGGCRCRARPGGRRPGRGRPGRHGHRGPRRSPARGRFRLLRHPRRRPGRARRGRADRPGRGCAGPGDGGRGRDRVRPADRPGGARDRPQDRPYRPGGVGHQLHQPGRAGHRGDGRGARRARDRHLRFARRPGAAHRAAAGRPAAGRLDRLRRPQPPGLGARAAHRRPRRAAPAAGRHRGPGVLRGGPALRGRMAALARRDPQ